MDLIGTRQNKHDCSNFLIFANPFEERFPLRLGFVLLVPVFNLHGGFENLGSSSGNSFLNHIKGRLHLASVVKLEGLTADFVFHLIERVLGRFEKSLIHGVVVIS